MAKAKKKRWVCSECGKGALGPSRPRKNATIRFCLKCSAKSNTLVERICPANETKRMAAKTRNDAKWKEKRAKERADDAARWDVGGIHLNKIKERVARSLKANYEGHRGRRMADRVLAVETTIYRTEYGSRGRANAYKCHLTLEGKNPIEDQELAVHELCHVACELLWEGTSHGTRFQSMLKSVACDFFGLTIGEIAKQLKTVVENRESKKRHRYSLDQAITKAVEKKASADQ